MKHEVEKAKGYVFSYDELGRTIKELSSVRFPKDYSHAIFQKNIQNKMSKRSVIDEIKKGIEALTD